MKKPPVDILRAALILLLLAGAAARIYGSWCLRHQHNMDAGVVAIMAKHIAEGREYPVFFYGQPHMGSFEAYGSALFYRFLPDPGFAVSLGTALVGFFTLVFLYLWARDIAGRFAGLAAMGFCIVGPIGYYHYNISPRGGYAATLTFGVGVLWLGTRMAVRWVRERRQSGLEFLALGLLAGLGWWSHQLTTAAILTAGVILLTAMKRDAFTWRILSGAAGFFIGSAPFWYYNVVNGWPSFEFLDSFGRMTFAQGLKLFFTVRFSGLTTLDTVATDWLRMGGYALIALMLVVCLAVWIRGLMRRDRAVSYGLGALFLFILISAVLFSTSHFAGMNTPRYLLPMIPVVSVMIGVAASAFRRWVPWPVALIPLLALSLLQWRSLVWADGMSRTGARFQTRLERFADYLREQKLEALLVHVTQHAWNFALREEFIFVDGGRERYRPYAQRGDYSERFGVIGNFGGLQQFLRNYGGQAKGDSAEGSRINVHHSFRTPLRGMREILPDEWRKAVDASGHDVRESLSDPYYRTGWRALPLPKPDWIEIEFQEAHTLCAIRMLADQIKSYPLQWRLEVRGTDGVWRDVVPEADFLGYYWSGERVYHFGRTHRFQAHFAPVEADAIRLHGWSDRSDWRWAVRLLQVFAVDGAVPGERESLPELAALLQERSVERVYADRYAANHLFRMTDGRIETSRDPEVFPETLPMHDDPRLSPATAIVVRTEDAPRTRRHLERVGISMRETAVGPWIVFDFAESGWMEDYRSVDNLHWSGFTLLLEHADYELRARRLEAEADALLERDPGDARAIELLESALEWEFHMHSVREKLIDAYDAAGRDEDAARQREDLRVWSQPDHPVSIRFSNGIEFLGYSLRPARVRRGDSFLIRYYWSIPPNILADRYVAFVHFLEDRRIRFQDDYALVDELPGLFNAEAFRPHVLMVDNVVEVAPDLSPGDYAIRFGVYDRVSEKRLRLRSPLSQRRRAVILPEKLTVD